MAHRVGPGTSRFQVLVHPVSKSRYNMELVLVLKSCIEAGVIRDGRIGWIILDTTSVTLEGHY